MREKEGGREGGGGGREGKVSVCHYMQWQSGAKTNVTKPPNRNERSERHGYLKPVASKWQRCRLLSQLRHAEWGKQ